MHCGMLQYLSAVPTDSSLRWMNRKNIKELNRNEPDYNPYVCTANWRKIL